MTATVRIVKEASGIDDQVYALFPNYPCAICIPVAANGHVLVDPFHVAASSPSLFMRAYPS
jgi:hypothetical protein